MGRLHGVQLWNIGILFLISACIPVYSHEATTGYYEVERTLAETTEFDQEYPKLEETVESIITYRQTTWRPKRCNCTPPAIEQFPRPLMGLLTRRHGGLVVHVIVAVFTFMGLAIVCDYFILTLDRLCEELKLSPDVAGATFMAIGNSAPELAIVLVGVLFAKDDIGISSVIGCGVFNITFVIAIFAFYTGAVCQLNWWPLVRGGFFYCLSILLLFFVMANGVISWMEASMMLVFYAVYCVMLCFNTAFEKWAFPHKLLVTYKSLCDTTFTQTSPSKDLQTNTQSEPQDHAFTNPNVVSGDNNNQVNQTTVVTIGQDNWEIYNTTQTEETAGERDQVGTTKQDHQEVGATISPVENVPIQSKYCKSKAPKYNPLERPVKRGLFTQISWLIAYPIHFMCRLTMFDCRTDKYKNWYPFNFFMSMVWIAFYSYFMVWMITIIGSTLTIPDTVMGLTFVAAGVSVPNALSSIAVVKQGYGDMAISNAIGSNIYDILVCLGLAWFLQTSIIAPGSYVNVISKGLVYTTFTLLSAVFFVLLSTYINGWKLNKRLGIVLMVWYVLFMTLSSLYELNIFAPLNSPECFSMY